MAGNFNSATMLKHTTCICHFNQSCIWDQPDTVQSARLKEDKSYSDNILGQPGRKRFVLDRSEPIKVVGDLPELLQS